MDLQTVVDRAEIGDLLALYCRGVDRRDEATLRSIYHEDAIEDRGADLFVGPAQQWVGWTLSLLPVFDLTQHCVLNSIIEIDGDSAVGETYFHAYHRFADAGANAQSAAAASGATLPDNIAWPAGGMELLLGGRYLDRFEKREGRWRISLRRMVCDWCRTQPLAEQWFADNPTAYRGRPHIADASLPPSASP